MADACLVGAGVAACSLAGVDFAAAFAGCDMRVAGEGFAPLGLAACGGIGVAGEGLACEEEGFAAGEGVVDFGASFTRGDVV